MSRLQAMHAVVTGAGSGLGQAIALRFAVEGARLSLLDLRPEGLQDTVRQAHAGSETAAFVVDVTRPADVEAAVLRAEKTHGPVDILVNCAGVIVRKGFFETTDDDWRRVLDVNVIGYASVLRATVPRMPRGGSVIQIASSAAHRGGHGYASYAASKGAILAATRHLAGELAPLGIRINSISPGPTTTALNRDVFADEAAVRAVAGAVPLGRIGEPADVVGAAVFLSSADSAYITGIDISVDGGLVSQVQLAAGADAYHGFRATSGVAESGGSSA